METLIITTPEEIKKIVQEAIAELIPEQTQETPDTMSLEDALAFLKKNGYAVSKATIYRLTSSNQIPYAKYGNRLVFSRKKILQWILSKTIDINTIKDDLVNSLAKNRK